MAKMVKIDTLLSHISESVNNFTHIIHNDHGLTEAHIEFIMREPSIAQAAEGHNIAQVFEMPDELPNLWCALYGPSCGDREFLDYIKGTGVSEIIYEERRCSLCNTTKGKSKLVDLSLRPTRKLAVIGVKGGPCHTAYGTRANTVSPLEEWEAEKEYSEQKITLKELEDSKQFWSVHALSNRTNYPKYRNPKEMGL